MKHPQNKENRSPSQGTVFCSLVVRQRLFRQDGRHDEEDDRGYDGNDGSEAKIERHGVDGADHIIQGREEKKRPDERKDKLH